MEEQDSRQKTETEKYVLSCAIFNPDALDLLINEHEEGLFVNFEAQRTFTALKELQESKGYVNWDLFIDACYLNIDPNYIADMVCKQDGIYSSGYMDLFKKALRELQDYLKEKRMRRIINQGYLSEESHNELLSILSAKSTGREKEKTPSVSTVIKEYEGWKDAEDTGIKLGYHRIDHNTGDFTWGEIVAIMGRTATGKTFAALNTIHSLRHLFNTIPIGFFSMEMSYPALGERMIQINSNVSRHEIKVGHLQDLEKTYEGLYIYNRVYSVSEIESIIKRDGLKVVFIDHLQLIKGQGVSLYEKTTRIMQDLKTMAKAQNIVLFILVQLSRKAGEGTIAVTLDMARDSGAIEEHSDFIVGIWNLEREVKGEAKDKDMRAMRLLKNKRGMTTGIKVHFNPETGRMIEVMPE